MLKKIEAYIRNEKLDDVRLALLEIGVPAIDTVEVQGHGRQSGIKLAGRHSTYVVDTLPRIQVNFVVVKTMLNRWWKPSRGQLPLATKVMGPSSSAPSRI